MERNFEYAIEQSKEWASNIPIEELFAELKKITGLSDLTFSTKIVQHLDNTYPRIMFESQDIVEKVGFLKLMFASIVISQFNSEIRWITRMDTDSIDKHRYYDDKEYKREIDNEFYSNGYFKYWGTTAFSYTHPGGGSNCCTFLTFWYDDNNGWKFESNH